MSRPILLVNIMKKTFSQRFMLARLTRVPVIGRLVDNWLFEDDDMVFLPRDGVISIEESLAPADQVVLPSKVVEHFIEKADHHWIMNSCICREATRCRDYPRDLGCLFLGEAALGINPKLGRRVSKDEALAHVERCREAGLVHLIGRNKLDTVWLGVGPGDRLVTICNCCPCCCLWRMMPELSPHISSKVTRMPGVTVTVTDACEGCGTCAQGSCFVDAISLEDGRAVIGEACRGCGRCVAVCPNGAIELTIETSGYVDETIKRLAPLFDLS
jgi:ferredoxin